MELSVWAIYGDEFETIDAAMGGIKSDFVLSGIVRIDEHYEECVEIDIDAALSVSALCESGDRSWTVDVGSVWRWL